MDPSDLTPLDSPSAHDETAPLVLSTEKQRDGIESTLSHSSPDDQAQQARTHTPLRPLTILLFCCLLAMFFFFPSKHRPVSRRPGFAPGGALPPDKPSKLCPQAPSLLPVRHAELAKKLEANYTTNAYKSRAYKVLGGAIRIP